MELEVKRVEGFEGIDWPPLSSFAPIVVGLHAKDTVVIINMVRQQLVGVDAVKMCGVDFSFVSIWKAVEVGSLCFLLFGTL